MPVLEAVVVEELLAVVGGEHHEGLVEEPALLEPFEEPPQLAIHEEQLLIVGPDHEAAVRLRPRLPAGVALAEAPERQGEPAGIAAREAAAHRRRRVVGEVRIEDVQHEQKRPLVARVEPAQPPMHDLAGARVLRVVDEDVIPGLEAAAETEGGMEEGVVDDRGGREAALRQDLAYRRRGLVQEGEAPLLRALAQEPRRVAARNLPGVERAEARQRPRGGGPGPLEDSRPCRPPVEGRRGRPLVAVHPEVIGAQRVHHHQHHRSRPRRLRCAARQQQREHQPCPRPRQSPLRFRNRHRRARQTLRAKCPVGSHQHLHPLARNPLVLPDGHRSSSPLVAAPWYPRQAGAHPPAPRAPRGSGPVSGARNRATMLRGHPFHD